MIVIVLGMHRSGTSALAGMLHANGIVMGKEEDWYPPPMKENPKGFYENVRFRRINDKILAMNNNYKVKSFSPDIPFIRVCDDANIRQLMKRLISEFSVYPYWGWKDPRTCLTFLSWWNAFYEFGLTRDVRVISIYRPPEEIADSMRARGNKEQHEGQFEALAIAYTNRLVKNLDESGVRHIRFTFKDLIDETEKCAGAISTFLEYNVDDLSFIEPEIARNVK